MRDFLTSTLIVFFSLFSAAASAGVRVVSDIDDTAKITDVGDPLLMVFNGLFTKRAFTGMAELYSTWAIERGYAFDYVTGSPEGLEFRATRFLHANGFPDGGLYLRPPFRYGSLREYKADVIRKLMARYPDDVFLLIGDDTQADFEAYDDLFRYEPDRILAIYIRKVTNHKLPPSAVPFLTAFDIARTESVMGRLKVPEAAPIALAILRERKLRRIVPSFSYCPVNAPFELDPQMQRWDTAIDARIQKICRSRKE
jgi:hypothetical protein